MPSSIVSLITAFKIVVIGMAPALISSFVNHDRQDFKFQLHQSFGTFESSPSSSSYASSLLDTEQAKGIASRALVEEGLLSEADQGFLSMANGGERKEALKVVKKMQKKKKNGSGGGGGFGSSSKAKIKKKADSPAYNPRLDKDGFGAVLIHEGVARINNVMSIETVDNLRGYVNKVLDEKIHKDTEMGSGDFARVLLPKNRWDLLLPLDQVDPVMQAMDELIGDEGSLNSILDSTVGKDGRIYEMACLVSDPGSERQVIHPDIPFESEDEVTLVTCFVALQDINEIMGPTVYLPRTNTAADHERFNNRATADEMLTETRNVFSTLDAGDCSVYNPATLHCGSANKSETRRAIFYLTFWNPRKEYPGTPNNPGSLREDLREQELTLKNLRQQILDWKSAP